MKLYKIDIKMTLLIMLLCIIEILIIFFVFNYQTILKTKEYLYSINVMGYRLDNEFNPNIYEYNLTVNDNIVEINCESNEKIEGCNISVELTDSGIYKHKIKVYNGKKPTIYTINIKYEEKMLNTFTAILNGNGSSVEKESVSCTTSSDSCEVRLPKIVTKYDALGWSTNKESTKADYVQGELIILDEDLTLYAITKKTFTATFDDSKLDYLASRSLSCTVYNTNTSCNIILPDFNKTGYFNEFWSPNESASKNLKGTNWSFENINQVGHYYELTNDITLYPNFNHFHYDLPDNAFKYRSLNISTSKTIGKTIFEFEKGIPQSAINIFITHMSDAYKLFPWLFVSGKIFVMTETTYSNYSVAYGLTHSMYSAYGGDSHFTIDLQYETIGNVVKNAIDVNAALHELAHTWDSYYNFKTGNGEISSLDDFNTFYNSISNKLYVYEDGSKISEVETFAGMFTNYYWHVLGKDTNKPYYALKDGVMLNSTELNKLKQFMEKYMDKAKNNYK